jgi:hypothetical protein
MREIPLALEGDIHVRVDGNNNNTSFHGGQRLFSLLFIQIFQLIRTFPGVLQERSPRPSPNSLQNTPIILAHTNTRACTGKHAPECPLWQWFASRAGAGVEGCWDAGCHLTAWALCPWTADCPWMVL